MFLNLNAQKSRVIQLLAEVSMRVALIVVLLAFTMPVLAGPLCTVEPGSKWLTKAEMTDRIETAAHQMDVFKKTDGNCYEIDGRDKSGKRTEVHFHPVTGKVVTSSSL